MKHCSIIEGHFVLHGEGEFEYDIAINRIQNPEDLIAWLIHISEKNWVHKEMLRDFILTVCNEKGWKTHGAL